MVGRSGSHFPPSAATVSGLFAAERSAAEPDSEKLKQLLKPLQVAGPFWAQSDAPANFCVPLPLNCLVKPDRDQVFAKLGWDTEQEDWLPYVEGKFAGGRWLKIDDWSSLAALPAGKLKPDDSPRVFAAPWKFAPHLHPRLAEDQRHVDRDTERGSLFLENAVQMPPETCLVYLSSLDLPDGWYRFGGEGHMVSVRCHELSTKILDLLAEPLQTSFATITPAVWGSSHYSYREPVVGQTQHHPWSVAALLTGRPSPFRYRFGGSGKTKRLARGRYAMPAGSVYVLDTPLNRSWQDWEVSWFPQEGVSFQRWGCGLALPL